MIVILDNYDSFTYNLYQLVAVVNPDVLVVRNDALDVDALMRLRPTHVIISPGPGHPADAGICVPAVRRLAGVVPVLGVCLGHQAVCEAFGARVGPARTLVHGKASLVRVVGDDPLFAGLPFVFQAGRYHSLSADPASLPDDLAVTAVSSDGEIQAVRHRRYHVHGVQFHPESVLTPLGGVIVANFLRLRPG